MRKIIAFLLVIACGIAALTGAHLTVSAQGDDVVITETVLQGDPAWLSGRTIRTELNWERHLYWDTAYTYGEGYDTQFRFVENDNVVSIGYGGDFYTYTCTNFGASGGEMDFSGEHGYGPIFRYASENAPDGQETTVTVHVADYLEYYPLEIELHYTEENRYCYLETSDLFDYINGKDNAGKLYPVERYFNENFPVPVEEDDTAEITIYKNENGVVTDVGMNLITGDTDGLNGITTEHGIYFWVNCYDADGNPVASDMGPEGPGIYFMPWKETGQKDESGRLEITPDVEQVTQVYSLELGTFIFLVESAWEGAQLRLLTWEDGWYTFTALDLETRAVKTQFRLAQEPDAGNADYPCWAWNDEVICTQIDGMVYLLWDHDGTITQEFAVPAGENDSAIVGYSRYSDALDYDGEKLIMVCAQTWYHDPGYIVCGYDREGLQLLAEYDVSVMQIIERIGYDNFDYARPVIE